MRKRIIIAGCLVLVGMLGAAGTAGYLTFVRSPTNPPAEACADGRGQDSRPVVVAAGRASRRAHGAGVAHYLLGRSWDEVARGGGRELLVDHVHLSDRGGALVTDLTARWLAE
jgi:hypothetical protein